MSLCIDGRTDDREMIQADLWGNATVSNSETIRSNSLTSQDLSLLVDLKYEDLQKLQAVGAAAQAEQAKLILRNDLDKAWAHIKSLKNGRVDIVMDNGECCLRGAVRPIVCLTTF